jgi:hypothetical protein
VQALANGALPRVGVVVLKVREMCCVWMAQRDSRESCARVCTVKRFCGGGWFALDYRSLDIWLELARSCTARSCFQTSNPRSAREVEPWIHDVLFAGTIIT